MWDTIHARDPERSGPIEEWGGVAYALSAFEADPPPGWRLLPIIKVGQDMREQAGRWLGRLRSLDSLDGVWTVPEPNNRVTLVYGETGRRCERLTGGVPGWSWEELEPLVRRCDAVYVNFIAGWELDLPAALGLRAGFDGPLYGDIHSLLLGVGPDGVRRPRPLADWRTWLACFDLVQINEDELGTLAGAVGDPLRLVAQAVGERTRAIFVTLGERGAAWVAAAGFERLETGGETDPGAGAEPAAAGRWAEARSALVGLGGVVSGMAGAPRRVEGGDPTGCGDVWGITCFASLLAGRPLREAVERANVLASRNAAFRGATRLAELLGSESPLLRDPSA